MAKKKKSDDLLFGIIVLIAIAVCFLPAALITYLYYKSYIKVPNSEERGTALFYSIVSCVPIYITGSVCVYILFNKYFGGSYDYEYLLIICVALIILISIPAWIAYLRKINNIKGMQTYIESYMLELDSILKDKRLDDEEIKKLNEMANKYKLSGEYLKRIHKQGFLSALFNSTTDDFEVNDSELDFLATIIEYFNSDKDMIDLATEVIRNAKSIKNIIDGKEQGISTTIFMPQKNERCILLKDCTLYENVKRGIYTGGSISLKNIVPFGQLLNPRFYLGTKINYENLKLIDKGKIALSTTRIVFIGESITRAINFDDIIGLDIGSDGFQINRQGKAKKEVFKLNEFTVVLFTRALLYLKR